MRMNKRKCKYYLKLSSLILMVLFEGCGLSEFCLSFACWRRVRLAECVRHHCRYSVEQWTLQVTEWVMRYGNVTDCFFSFFFFSSFNLPYSITTKKMASTANWLSQLSASWHYVFCKNFNKKCRRDLHNFSPHENYNEHKILINFCHFKMSNFHFPVI